ncbi:hypothetical protein V5D56_07395 [Cellulosimicrobium sp. PMB13]|uniref:hypothetical protein n=1 Tax=Cellulosimicrobium sp. PMB13 TaxID=3120158 RepID=UPI003F4B329D
MFWMIAGAVLVVSGLAVSAAAVRATPRDRSTGANGLAIGCGAGLVLWGVIALVVALALRS